MKNGGEVIYHMSFLKDADPKTIDLKNINMRLRMYGTIHQELMNDTWARFTIDDRGIKFMDGGGYNGEAERNDYKSRMETLNMEIAELQSGKLKYEKRIRHMEKTILVHKFIEAAFALCSLILVTILFFLEN